MDRPPSPTRSDHSADYNTQNIDQLLDRATYTLRYPTPVCSANEPRIPFKRPLQHEEGDEENVGGENEDDIDVHPLDLLCTQLRSYGLSDADIECARRWNQPPIQESRDVYHLSVLRDLVQHLPENSTRTPVQLLQSAFSDAQQKGRNIQEHNDATPPSQSSFEKAQKACSAVVRELIYHDDISTAEFSFYMAITKGGQETYDAVTEFCFKRLTELKFKRMMPMEWKKRQDRERNTPRVLRSKRVVSRSTSGKIRKRSKTSNIQTSETSKNTSAYRRGKDDNAEEGEDSGIDTSR